MSKFLTALGLAISIWIPFGPVQAWGQAIEIESGVTLYGSVEISQAPILAEEFRAAASRGLEQLESLGILKLDGITLPSIRERLAQLKIQFIFEVRYQNTDALATFRGTAYWHSPSQTIYVGNHHWERFSQRQKIAIALHELFGIVGVQDKNFVKTSLLDTIDLIQFASKNRPRLRERTNSTVEILREQLGDRAIQNQGGVTGVGGGGDTRPLTYKTTLLTEACMAFLFQDITADQFRKLAVFFQNLQIEFSKRVAQGDLQYFAESNLLVVPNNAFTTATGDINTAAAQKFMASVLPILEKLP